MGGHGHGHEHHVSYTVPDYKIYKVEDVPELLTTQKALHAQGLHDPWLRNEVWRYDPKVFGTEGTRIKALFFRGFKWGFAAFVGTMALTGAYDFIWPSKKHGHGDSHDSEEH